MSSVSVNDELGGEIEGQLGPDWVKQLSGLAGRLDTLEQNTDLRQEISRLTDRLNVIEKRDGRPLDQAVDREAVSPQSVDFRHQLTQIAERVESLEERADEDRLVLGVIKGDFDTTMAAFIIAVGAAASGMEVDMFFTFWATAALRDAEKDPGPKGFMDRMFGWMLPRGCGKLPLSKMQMGGIGPHIIRHVMKKHNTLPMEELVKNAGELGVRIHVCEMSMELMGLKREGLIDYPHMDFVGVGSFIGMADKARQCFFL